MKGDVYGEPTIIKVGNNVARVYSPILTDEERERRRERMIKSAIELVLSVEEKKGQKDEQ